MSDSVPTAVLDEAIVMVGWGTLGFGAAAGLCRPSQDEDDEECYQHDDRDHQREDQAKHP